MDFKNGVKNIQAAGYNGARTVIGIIPPTCRPKFATDLRFKTQNVQLKQNPFPQTDIFWNNKFELLQDFIALSTVYLK